MGNVVDIAATCCSGRPPTDIHQARHFPHRIHPLYCASSNNASPPRPLPPERTCQKTCQERGRVAHVQRCIFRRRRDGQPAAPVGQGQRQRGADFPLSLSHCNPTPALLFTMSQVDGDGNSPLHWAAVKGHANIIDLLLLAQADPNLPNKDRDTPLHWAASGGSAECVQKLLARNANPTAKNSENTTPLHFAAADGKAAVAVTPPLLNPQSNPNLTHPFLQALLIRAMHHSSRLHVNDCNNDRDSPLHWACRSASARSPRFMHASCNYIPLFCCITRMIPLQRRPRRHGGRAA